MRRVLAAALFAVAGCEARHQGEAAQRPAAKVGGAALSGFPARRPGLWEQTLLRDGGRLGPGGKMRYCLDAASDRRLGLFGRQTAGSLCQQPTVSRMADGGLRFATSCALGKAGVVASQGTLSGDFSSNYRVHTQTEVSGAPLAGMNGQHVLDISARYVGPCPAAMSPGDVVLSGNLKGNINRLGHVFR